MSFPWADWQFWVVTLACAWGAWAVARPFMDLWRSRDSSGVAPCPGCDRCGPEGHTSGDTGDGLVKLGDR